MPRKNRKSNARYFLVGGSGDIIELDEDEYKEPEYANINMSNVADYIDDLPQEAIDIILQIFYRIDSSQNKGIAKFGEREYIKKAIDFINNSNFVGKGASSGHTRSLVAKPEKKTGGVGGESDDEEESGSDEEDTAAAAEDDEELQKMYDGLNRGAQTVINLLNEASAEFRSELFERYGLDKDADNRELYEKLITTPISTNSRTYRVLNEMPAPLFFMGKNSGAADLRDPTKIDERREILQKLADSLLEKDLITSDEATMIKDYPPDRDVTAFTELEGALFLRKLTGDNTIPIPSFLDYVGASNRLDVADFIGRYVIGEIKGNFGARDKRKIELNKIKNLLVKGNSKDVYILFPQHKSVTEYNRGRRGTIPSFDVFQLGERRNDSIRRNLLSKLNDTIIDEGHIKQIFSDAGIELEDVKKEEKTKAGKKVSVWQLYFPKRTIKNTTERPYELTKTGPELVETRTRGETAMKKEKARRVRLAKEEKAREREEAEARARAEAAKAAAAANKKSRGKKQSEVAAAAAAAPVEDIELFKENLVSYPSKYELKYNIENYNDMMNKDNKDKIIKSLEQLVRNTKKPIDLVYDTQRPNEDRPNGGIFLTQIDKETIGKLKSEKFWTDVKEEVKKIKEKIRLEIEKEKKQSARAATAAAAASREARELKAAQDKKKAKLEADRIAKEEENKRKERLVAEKLKAAKQQTDEAEKLRTAAVNGIVKKITEEFDAQLADPAKLAYHKSQSLEAIPNDKIGMYVEYLKYEMEDFPYIEQKIAARKILDHIDKIRNLDSREKLYLKARALTAIRKDIKINVKKIK
jgi:hypothetical protein